MTHETSQPISSLNIRVYYEDTDTAGVVFYANYLKFFERGRTEWLRRLGINQTELAARENIMFVVKDVAVQYRKPARLDDLIAIHSKVTHVGRAFVDFEQSAQIDDVMLCDSTIRVCGVDTRTFKPIKFPHNLRSLLEKAQN